MANENKKNSPATAVALAGGAALAIYLATRKQPASGSIPQSIIDQIADIDTVKLVELIAAVKAISVNVQGYAPNADILVSTRLPLLIANNAVQLSDQPVDDDFVLMIKADPGNPVGSLIRVASTKADAESVASYPLIPNEFRTLKIKNASSLYVSATIVPAWVIVSTERSV